MTDLSALLPAIALMFLPLYAPPPDAIMVSVCGSESPVRIPLEREQPRDPTGDCGILACHALTNSERRGSGLSDRRSTVD